MKGLLLFILLIFLISCAPVKKEAKEIPKDAVVATFAGGCFWCMEAAYEDIEGVYSVISGYTGGNVENPSYSDVSTGKTGHYEAIQVFYDDSKVAYEDLLDLFWRQIDPTDDGGQFADRGSQYKTAIFYHDSTQKKLAEESKKKLADSEKFDKPIATEIIQFDDFFPAEEYHQDYSKKRTVQYKIYEQGSGRKSFKERVWSKEFFS